MNIPEKYYDRAAWGFCVAFILIVAATGPWLHPIGDFYGPEVDGYLHHVDEFREGNIPKDPFRPLFYPILSTFAAVVVNDTFLGAKLISALSGGIMILAAYYLGTSLFGRKVGLFGAILLGTNRHILLASFRAATDITFCAMATLALLSQVRFLRSGKLRHVIPTSLFFSLSFFTRYVALFFLPVFAGGFLLKGDFSYKKRFAYLTVFGGCAILFLIPHFTLQTLAFGSPLYNENWRNLLLKIKDLENTQVFYEPMEGSLWEVISDSPGETVRSWGNEVRKMVFYNFMKLNGHNTAGAFYAVLLVLGILYLFPTRDAARISLIGMIGFYLLFLCFFFYFMIRLGLPILPFSYPIIANYLLGAAFADRLSFFGKRVSKSSVLAIVFLTLNLHASRDDLRAFYKRHTFEEIEAAIQLQKDYGKDLVVVGTYWAITRHVDYEYRLLPTLFKKGEHGVRAYLNRCRPKLKEIGATHLMVGKKTLMIRPPGLLSGQNVPPYFQMIKKNQHVTIYEITGYGP